MDTAGVGNNCPLSNKGRIKVVCGMGFQTPFSYDAIEFPSGEVIIIIVMCAVWLICSGVHSNIFDLV